MVGIVTLEKRKKAISTDSASKSSAVAANQKTTSEDELPTDEKENAIIGRLFLGEVRGLVMNATASGSLIGCT